MELTKWWRTRANEPFGSACEKLNQQNEGLYFCTENIDELIKADPEKTSALQAKSTSQVNWSTYPSGMIQMELTKWWRTRANEPFGSACEKLNQQNEGLYFCTENIDELIKADPEKASALRA